jgi:hypothetical protein
MKDMAFVDGDGKIQPFGEYPSTIDFRQEVPQVVMPITSPSKLTSAPPLLPGW